MTMKQIRILFTSGFVSEEMKEKLEEAGYEILFAEEKSVPPFALDDVEILVCYNPFEYLNIEKMPSLKWIHLVSKGINHVPIEKVKKRNIVVTNTIESTAIPISEWIVAQILCLYKQIPLFIKQQKEKKYCYCEDIRELYHKKVLILGTGFIAKETAKRLKGFELSVHGMNHTGHEAGELFQTCYPIGELTERIKEYDIVISTLPATKETYHILGRKQLSLLKETAIVVNVSRGSVIDTEALCNLLEKKAFKGAALDVFEIEPLPVYSKIWDIPNIYVTPHNAYLSEYYRTRNVKEVFDNLIRYKKKEPLKGYVNFEKGY